MPRALTSKDGALWIQPGGPNTETFFLGCHDVSDLTDPKGAKTIFQCFRPDGSGWDVIGQTNTPPDAVTLTITSLLFPQRDWLERVNCPYGLYLMMRDCGSANVFNNYVRGQLLTNVENTQRSYSNMAMRSEDVEASLAVDVEAWPPLIDIDRLVVDNIANAQTGGFNDVVANDDERCYSDCGATLSKGNDAAAVADSFGGAAGDVDFSTDEGLTWASNVAPVPLTMNAMAITRFMVGRDTVRWLVGEEGQGAVQGHTFYSDDAGAAWAGVNIGGMTGEGPVYGGSLFALDQHHIWMCGVGGAADDAYIWFSADGGESWTIQEAGIISLNAYSQIHFADELNGMAVTDTADVVVRTDDGGATWEAATPTAAATGLRCVHMIDANRAWVGADDGTLWYTTDRGTTWHARVGWNVTTGVDLRDIDFANEYQGIMVVNAAGPVLGSLYYTTDGGYTWDLLTTPTNIGLNAVWMAKTPNNQGLAYAVGEIGAGAVGIILKVSIL